MIQTLNLLVQLQEQDTALDTLAKKKGSLPKELDKLKAEVENLQNTLQSTQAKIDEQQQTIANHKATGQKAEELAKKYIKEQPNTLDNNQEYEAITKEIASQELKVQLAKKRIKDCQIKLGPLNDQLLQIEHSIATKQKTIEIKTDKLAKIHEDSKEEEDKLQHCRQELLKKIKDEDLVEKYQRMRKHMSLVITSIAEEACSGCFIIVPAQRQIEIRKKKKIITCENCGRILV